MKISQTISTPSYRASDFPAPITAVIEAVTQVIFDNQPKVCLILEGHTKRLLLNRTNAMALAHAFGDETDDWAGRHVQVWSEMTTFNGRDVPGIRVNEWDPVAGARPASVASCRQQGRPHQGIYGDLPASAVKPARGVSAPDIHPH